MSEQVNVEVIRSEVEPVVMNAASMNVTCAEEYNVASNFLKTIKGAQSKVTAFFAPMKQKAHEAHKAITMQESAMLKPLQDAENSLKRNMLTFYAEQERIRINAQRKLQAEADEAARKERERLEREASKLKTPELREQRMEQAASVIAPVVQVASVAPVVSGQSVRKTWTAKVVDSELVPREWMVVNQSALDAFARSTKGAVKVPGVEFVESMSLASSGR